MSDPHRPIAFTGLTLDRADDRRGDPDWIAAQLADPNSRFLAIHRAQPAVRETDAGLVLAWEEGAQLNGQEPVFLGLNDKGHARFAFPCQEDACPAQASWMDGRSLAMKMSVGMADGAELATAGLARSLVDWHDRHGFCARCGEPTRQSKGGYARHCDACGADHFPRVDPVVIMMIVKGERCILGRQHRFPPGFFSALAGFVEPGETMEEAVRRESREEAGVDVSNVRYLLSQPWPFPSSLMLGCIAETDSETLVPDVNELEAVDWFEKDQVRAALQGMDAPLKAPPPIAVAHHLMRYWCGLP